MGSAPKYSRTRWGGYRVEARGALAGWVWRSPETGWWRMRLPEGRDLVRQYRLRSEAAGHLVRLLDRPSPAERARRHRKGVEASRAFREALLGGDP